MIDSNPGWYWEFIDHEGGLAFHKTDAFFKDSSGRGFALLFQAPTGEWSTYEPLFRKLRETLSTS